MSHWKLRCTFMCVCVCVFQREQDRRHACTCFWFKCPDTDLRLVFTLLDSLRGTGEWAVCLACMSAVEILCVHVWVAFVPMNASWYVLPLHVCMHLCVSLYIHLHMCVHFWLHAAINTCICVCAFVRIDVCAFGRKTWSWITCTCVSTSKPSCLVNIPASPLSHSLATNSGSDSKRFFDVSNLELLNAFDWETYLY